MKNLHQLFDGTWVRPDRIHSIKRPNAGLNVVVGHGEAFEIIEFCDARQAQEYADNLARIVNSSD